MSEYPVKIFEWAQSIENDGTQSQVGPKPNELHDLARYVIDLEFALVECVEANDALHNALCNDSQSEPRHHEIFVAAQRRETAAIEAARKLMPSQPTPRQIYEATR